ncbi:MAG: rhodanese-related sulfurtransferase [Alphaproteobacteria bacterium]|nr:rhodanese-related sulfurtransferase [Alphaproteobacteria bacterium]
MTYTVAALYRFTPIADVPTLRTRLKNAFEKLGICGSLLIAPEGINGTLAGSADGIEAMLNLLQETTGLTREEVKFSTSPFKPFDKLKVRLKKEIVTFKQPSANPHERVGTYVEPKDWNALISDPNVTVLDTRNTYETMVGVFEGAIDPNIEQFTDFADFVAKTLDPNKHSKIAMYCTGGIRCEKASAYMLAQGFPEVYHLKGGILKYLEEIPREESKWNGECYVFDRRMAVGHGLSTGAHAMCFSCGYPLNEADQHHPLYEAGVSCHHCHATTSEADKARFRMRHTQMTSSTSTTAQKKAG